MLVWYWLWDDDGSGLDHDLVLSRSLLQRRLELSWFNIVCLECNKDQLEDFEEFNWGSVTFGGSKGYISGKGKIRVGTVPENNSTSTPSVNTGSQKLILVGLIMDDSSMPELENLSQDVARIESYQGLCTQPLGFVDPDHPNKVYRWSSFIWDCIKLIELSWCDEFEALMKSRFQMSSIGELTFFLGLQVKQNKGGIFISQNKYVAEILKKFNLVNVKASITPMETKVPLTKDEEAIDVDVTLKISHLNAIKRIFKYLKGKPKLGVNMEEASLAEAIRLDTLQKEEVAKQVHLDALLAQRIAEEEELNEQQKKRRAQVQFEAQHYTDEDWDLIRVKIEANAELSINVCLESDLKEKILQRDESWGHGKLSQLKNLSFERSQGKICDISRDDLTELYRIVMNRYGMDGPGEELGSKDHCGRYYDLEEYHCLNLEKYPLSAEICKTMLDKKLQGGKPDEDCYKMLKMMEKQAGIRK
ncbi:retrovirus-related pol polyprotein from transposon TNT 1-94 [Tanacetum coccineum]